MRRLQAASPALDETVPRKAEKGSFTISHFDCKDELLYLPGITQCVIGGAWLFLHPPLELPSPSPSLTMATKQLSPTGNLFRRSRLFSLPPPLRKPLATNEDIRGSSSLGSHATIHPTHAAIETPPASLSRGDWGLKRPLPLRSTTSSSTPVMRVLEIDSIAHIVEFESASDHVQTLRKVQEMSVPVVSISSHESKEGYMYNSHHSPFEEDASKASTRSRPSTRRTRGPPRWRYDGPFVAGLEQGKFDAYLRKMVKTRRDEFLRYLWVKLLEKKRAAQTRKAQQEGLEPPDARSFTTQEFAAGLVQLRQEGTELWRYIREFFDLSDEMLFSNLSGFNVAGPPATHPSAGLSYLRSSAVTPNHPVFGPTKSGAPIPGRALDERFDGRRERFNTIGVGGITVRGHEGLQSSMTGQTQANEYGGSRVWVNPLRASIESSGRVNLMLEPPGMDARDLWKDVAYTYSDDSAKTQGASENRPKRKQRRV